METLSISLSLKYLACHPNGRRFHDIGLFDFRIFQLKVGISVPSFVRAQHALPLPLFQTRAVVRVHLVDEAAFVQFAHQTAVDDIFDFDFSDFGVARFQ